MFVAIFNLSNNEIEAKKLIDLIVSFTSLTYDQWMDLKFLGVLLHIRHNVVCDKYFLRRKKEFSKSFLMFLHTLRPALLQRVSFIRLYSTLFAFLVCCKDFSNALAHKLRSRKFQRLLAGIN